MNMSAVAVGGFIGAMLRYSISFLFPNTVFPMGTLSVNLIGCIMLGWFLTNRWVEKHMLKTYKLGIGTGLIGSFTTFSTFSVDTLLIARSNLILAGLYVVLSVVLGLLFVKVGVIIGKTKYKEKGR